MEKCENDDSSHIEAQENLLHKLYLSMIEKKWTKMDQEVLTIEAFRSASGHHFSVIYGIDSFGSFNKVSVHCDNKATLDESNEFAEIVFREEMKEKMNGVPEFFLLLQPDVLYSPFLEKFKRVTNNIYSSGEEYELYFPSSIAPLEIPELTPGYQFGSIKETNFDFITQIWLQDLQSSSSSSDVSYMRMYAELNSKRPHVAIFHEKDNSLVGWMFVYADGGIGQLHVLEMHRRKGLARIMVRKLAWLVKKAHGIVPPVMIESGNSISSNFFKSEGWIKTPRTYQVIVSKKLES